MSRKIILSIIVLMAIALIGLVTLQVYWVGNALRLKEQEFETKVHEAMAEVVESNENMIMNRTWGEKINFFTSEGKTYFVIVGDTVEIPAASNNMNINVEMLPRMLYFNSAITGNMEESFEEISRYHKLDKHLRDQMKEKQWMEYRKLLMQKMAGELSMFSIPKSFRLDIEFLKKKLDKCLKKRGIDLEYKFGIVEAGSDSILTTQSIEGEKLLSSEYQAELYPSGILLSPAHLHVYFPKKFGFLLQTLVFRMLSSVVLILIIIFSFGFTIYTIYRQKKLSEMKNDFINNMTHEFKTPITTISLAGQALSDKSISQDESRVERFSRMILDETTKLGNQVEKILQMAVLDKGSFKIKVKEVDLHNIINKVAEAHQLRLKNEQGYLLVNFDATHSVIMGDEMHLSNLIDNLIDNAVKYCQEYPEVKINTKNGKGGINIHVEDNGIGMALDTQKRIFERFYRVPTGNIHNVKGFGLGLAYVKTIVDAHGGKISVSSELNKGTKFRIYLPYNYFEN